MTTSPEAADRCPHCGARRLSTIEVETRGGPRLMLVCNVCHRHIEFVAMPWTLERARAFTCPYGKHRGTAIGELAATEDGRGYLRWVSENIGGNFATAARMALAESTRD